MWYMKCGFGAFWSFKNQAGLACLQESGRERLLQRGISEHRDIGLVSLTNSGHAYAQKLHKRWPRWPHHGRRAEKPLLSWPRIGHCFCECIVWMQKQIISQSLQGVGGPQAPLNDSPLEHNFRSVRSLSLKSPSTCITSLH